ncbi:MAG: 30S ribosomal protein S2 [Candidatus Hodgkinia cicadicola]
MGIWQGFSVMNINKAVAALEAALSLMFEAVAQGGKVLFVCSSEVSPEAVSEWLAGADQHYMAKPVGGVLTNWVTFRKTSERVKRYQRCSVAVKSRRLTKFYLRKAEKADATFTGFNEFDCLPKAVVTFCRGTEASVVSEANRLDVPVVGIADSTADVRGIDYVVPVCSSSATADLFVCKLLAGVCSAASMVCNRSRSIASVVKAHLPNIYFREDFKLLAVWLHFKAAFLEAPTTASTCRLRLWNWDLVLRACSMLS